MLFHVSWDFIDATEERSRRSPAVFSAWQPPAGAEFKGFYGYATGGGGLGKPLRCQTGCRQLDHTIAPSRRQT